MIGPEGWRVLELLREGFKEHPCDMFVEWMNKK